VSFMSSTPFSCPTKKCSSVHCHWRLITRRRFFHNAKQTATKNDSGLVVFRASRYNQASHAPHLPLRAVASLFSRPRLYLLLQPRKPAATHASLAEGPHRRGCFDSSRTPSRLSHQRHRCRPRIAHYPQLQTLSLRSPTRFVGSRNHRVRLERSLLRPSTPRPIHVLAPLPQPSLGNSHPHLRNSAPRRS
jgi:hypothetical protein